MGKTKIFEPLGIFSQMAACRSSSKNTRKMNLKPNLNKTSPWAHMELEFDVFGIPGKLVKYVVHLSKRKTFFSSYKLPKLQLTIFRSQGIYKD
jgi:hypothetical protein